MIRGRLLSALVLLLLAIGCAAGVNEATRTPNEAGLIAGFWRGVWHGMIAPFTLVISLFKSSVQVYEIHNNGGWYNFGFLLGVGAFTHGGARGARRRPRRRREPPV